VNYKGKAYLLVLVVCFWGLSNGSSHAQLLTVTPHDLLPEQRVIVEGDELPQWQMLWEQARKSARQGDFEKAVRQYRTLLREKSNLEEARWELASLMMYLKRWVEADELLELLIESSPASTLYINSLGKVMWEMGQYERAVDLFKRVYDKNPSDNTALAGLVEGLIKLNRKSEALPYLEQLTLQAPTNRGVRRYLAFLLYEDGNYEKAKTHFTILARNDDVEIDVLYKTAETYEHLGLEQQASAYWERLLARQPQNIEAHKFLAKHYEKLEQVDRALSHLQALLAQNPEDGASYIRLGTMLENSEEYGEALTYYEKYLQQYPNDPKILQRLARINAIMKERQLARSLQAYSAEEEQDRTDKLKGIILDLETVGRYQDAVPYYRELLSISPEDHETLEILANNLVAIEKNKGNSSMLQFLSDIATDNISLYRSMAELLRQLDHEEHLLAVLHKIHELDPKDNLSTQELAILYLNRGELLLSRKYFSELSDSDCSNSFCLEARALLEEKLNLPAHRLQDYEALLKEQPDRDDIRLAAISLAVHMGLLDTAVFHAGYLQASPPLEENYKLKVLLADAYRESGYLTRAVERYRTIIEETAGNTDAVVLASRIHCWLGLAESYEQLGLLYEAEQELRRALVLEENRLPILEALFYLFLRSDRTAESAIWLQAFNLETEGSTQDSPVAEDSDWKKEFLQAEMYKAAGNYSQATDLYSQAIDLLPAYENNYEALPQDSIAAEAGFRIRKQLAANLLQAQEYTDAEQIILGLKKSHEVELELLVLLEKIYLAWGKDAEAEKIAEEAGEYAAQDFGRQLKLTSLYKKYRNIPRQSEAAEKAAILEPESLAAKLLVVEARIQQKEYFAALELLNQFLKSYPENTWFLTHQAGLLANIGKFPDALNVAEMILNGNPERLDILLLQARILWEMNRWKDSVSLYETVANYPLEEILKKNLQKQRLTVDQSPTKSTWWEVVTFSEGTPLTISQVIMAPQHAVDFSPNAQIANSVAASYYSFYRWQDRFKKELSVRRSVMRREYYHAANKLEKIIKEFGSNDFLLYDLAGLYSKLERLNDEATLYREIEAQNAYFPGLSESAQRNNLKRRPTIFLAYVMQYDDGWDGYMGVRQEILQGGGKYYKTTNQEWNFDIARINYESTQNDQNLLGWRTLLTYDAKLSQALGLSLGGGVQKLASVYDDTPLWSGSFTGKIADEMRAVFSAKQDVVPDTIASLKRNIKRRDYKIELMFDLFPRLLLGGYYDLIDYSDSNWTHNYTFWASYIIWPEPTLLKISYDYDLYDSHEGQIPGVPSEDGFAPDDHPYWSPVNYWVTRFSIYFKHQLSDDTLARGVPSYYAIEYSFGYDAEDNDLHEFKASLNFEIAKNYVLSASYGFLNLDVDVYKHKEGLLSLMYRF
jgi:tetratricopeptide (TPR) repeat protein